MERQVSPPLASPIDEVCRRLGIGRTMVYELIKTKALVPIKIGCRTVIPEVELQRFIASRMEQTT